jgi:hypothetical protein
VLCQLSYIRHNRRGSIGKLKKKQALFCTILYFSFIMLLAAALQGGTTNFAGFFFGSRLAFFLA